MPSTSQSRKRCRRRETGRSGAGFWCLARSRRIVVLRAQRRFGEGEEIPTVAAAQRGDARGPPRPLVLSGPRTRGRSGRDRVSRTDPVQRGARRPWRRGRPLQLDHGAVHRRRPDRLVAPAREPLRPADGRGRLRDLPVDASGGRTRAVPYTVGQAFDLLPPSCSCTCSWPSRRSAGAPRASARAWRPDTRSRSGCELVGAARRLRAGQPALAATRSRLADAVLDVQLITLSAPAPGRHRLLAAGGGAAAAAAPLDRPAGRLLRARPGDDRRPVLAGAFECPGLRDDPAGHVRAIGLAPIAFLVGLLRAPAARSASATWSSSCASSPRPADLRDALARALRDPSLTLAYWLPEFGSWADVDGPRVSSCRSRRAAAGRRR